MSAAASVHVEKQDIGKRLWPWPFTSKSLGFPNALGFTDHWPIFLAVKHMFIAYMKRGYNNSICCVYIRYTLRYTIKIMMPVLSYLKKQLENLVFGLYVPTFTPGIKRRFEAVSCHPGQQPRMSVPTWSHSIAPSAHVKSPAAFLCQECQQISE